MLNVASHVFTHGQDVFLGMEVGMWSFEQREGVGIMRVFHSEFRMMFGCCAIYSCKQGSGEEQQPSTKVSRLQNERIFFLSSSISQ